MPNALNTKQQQDQMNKDVNLLLLEGFTETESGVVQVVDCRLDGAAARLHRPVQIFLGDAARAEHVAVGKVLRGKDQLELC